ncbi:unnamed protein product [Phytophthora fragariaefolia]|uniref:Unnamed protein product n=1 Tax=Phytophthora fragariaefolia TaxID=1490495 RepID=A0A9W6XXQ9_9STRA|nr:unnamed protein product [Phytophthora fragariaefolia]
MVKRQRSTRPTRRSSRLAAASENNDDIDQPIPAIGDDGSDDNAGNNDAGEVHHSEGDNTESECEENPPANATLRTTWQLPWQRWPWHYSG